MNKPSQTGLEIKQVRLSQGRWTRDYELSLACQGRLALTGVSGLGKSSLLLSIAGFTPVQRGEILWNQQPIHHLAPEQRPVAMLFQADNLFEHLSVEQNLLLGLDPNQHGIEAVRLAADELGIAGELIKKPPQLSGGQRQRAALLRTLLRPEPLILLDEPFAELDTQTRKTTLAWVRRQLELGGKTLLMVTHQQGDAELLECETRHLE